MDVIERLTKQGKELGNEGETLQTFIKEQQIELRDERKAMMREAGRERCKAETAKCEAEAKFEREKLELIEKIEAQKRDAAREAREAESAKREAEAKLEREKLELMEKN